ncbi:MAG: class I SAM-dependent methyltransferase [Planctomycetia bacterium]|nr:class I SAM-dependent methyltransferase [Planctomycetia bacterium]
MDELPKSEQEAWSRVTDRYGTREATLGARSTARLRNDPASLSITLARYKFLARLASKNRRILELGVWEPLGSRILAEFAAAYVGVDAEAPFAEEANRLFEPFAMQFRTDVVQEAAGYDLVVCLEFARALAAVGSPTTSPIAPFFDLVLRLLDDDGIVAVGINYDSDAGHSDSVRRAMDDRFAQVFEFRCYGESITVDCANQQEHSRTGYALLIGMLPRRAADRARRELTVEVTRSPDVVPSDEPIRFGRHLCHWLHQSPRRLLHSMAYYRFGAELIGPNRKVLDVGCGEGLGTWLLAQRNGAAVGLDFDAEAIEVAQGNFHDRRVRFACGDFFETPVEKYDALVNFDCIEHILPQNVDRFWSRITEHLADDGLAIVGTPSLASDAYANPTTRAGHVNLYSGDRLEAEMSQHFRQVFLFSANDETIHTGFRQLAHYYLGVGVGPIRRPTPRE